MRRAIVSLFACCLFVVPGASAAKPSSSVPPKSSASVPKTPVPATKPLPRTIDPKVAKRLAKTKALDDANVLRIGKRFKIKLIDTTIRDPIVLSVRNPYHGPRTFIQLVAPAVYDPKPGPDGAALLFGGKVESAEEPNIYSLRQLGEEEYLRRFNPWQADFTGQVELVEKVFTIHIDAAANLDYVVSCTIPDAPAFGAYIVADGTFVSFERELLVENRRVSLAIARAPERRRLEIDILPRWDATPPGLFPAFGSTADVEFTVGRCDIVPHG